MPVRKGYTFGEEDYPKTIVDLHHFFSKQLKNLRAAAVVKKASERVESIWEFDHADMTVARELAENIAERMKKSGPAIVSALDASPLAMHLQICFVLRPTIEALLVEAGK